MMFTLATVFRLVGAGSLLRMADPTARPVAYVARQVAVSVLLTAPMTLVRPIVRVRLPGGWLRRPVGAAVVKTVQSPPAERKRWPPRSKRSIGSPTPKRSKSA
ncbi:MAG: hypothetical protein ACOC7R_03500 [Planctomycetota bacterium]